MRNNRVLPFPAIAESIGENDSCHAMVTSQGTDSPVNGTSASTFAGIFELLSGS